VKKKTRGKIKMMPFLLILIPLLTIIFGAFKYLSRESSYVYVKIKMSQGLWWASTTKPNLWLAKSINVGDKQTSFLDKTLAEITEIRYYPYISRNSDSISEDKYNVYLTVKLSVGTDSKGNFIYNRSNLIVGTPIEVETGKTQITGTVTEISPNEFPNNFVTKKVTLLKMMGYIKGNPYPYLGITIGDKYFDGTENVVEIASKSLRGIGINSSDDFGVVREQTSKISQNIVIEANLKVRKIGDEYIFGEEKVLRNGEELYVPTDNFSFEGYVVSAIE
jgi:hypothetical protein